MQLRVVEKLALVKEDTTKCPFCDGDLAESSSLVRYQLKGKSRDAFCLIQECKSCKEVLCTPKQLRRIKTKSYGIDVKTFPMQINGVDMEQHKSQYIYIDRPDPEPVYKKKAKTSKKPKTTDQNSIKPKSTNKTKSREPKQKFTGPQITYVQKKTENQDKTVESSKAKKDLYAIEESSGRQYPELKTINDVVTYFKAPKSTILAVCYIEEGSKEEKYLFVVSRSEDQQPRKMQFSIFSSLGMRVIEKVSSGGKVFRLNSLMCAIVKEFRFPQFETEIKPIEPLIHVSKDPTKVVSVYVYNLMGVCRRHDRKTERIVVNMISSRADTPHPLEVYYCPLCNKYYVNKDTYFEFYKKYGMPPLRLFSDSDYSDDNPYASLREHSDLYLYGYNVGGALATNERLRRQILEDIIDSGNLTKAQVISHLEFLIRFGKNNTLMKDAIQRWQDDMHYIESYKPKYSGLLGKFTPPPIK